jgi:hypothetical protein
MKQSQPKLPKANIVIRLSVRDRQLILAGLSWIVYKLLDSGMRAIRPLQLIWAGSFDPGVFNQELADGMRALHRRVLALSPGGRLRVGSSFEIAACALAVRVYAKRQQRGRTVLVMPRVSEASKRILRRLEAARKRAKRAELRQLGLDSYRARAHNWRRFVRWIRVHIPDCGARITRSTTRRRYLRLIVDQLVSLVRTELRNRKQRLPGEAELRRLIRLALRYVRRGRRGFDVRDLTNDKLFASAYLATFITIRMEKAADRRRA